MQPVSVTGETGGEPAENRRRTGGCDTVPAENRRRTGGCDTVPAENRRRTGGCDTVPAENRRLWHRPGGAAARRSSAGSRWAEPRGHRDTELSSAPGNTESSTRSHEAGAVLSPDRFRVGGNGTVQLQLNARFGSVNDKQTNTWPFQCLSSCESNNVSDNGSLLELMVLSH